MKSDVWEDFISLNTGDELTTTVLGPAKDYQNLADGIVTWDQNAIPLSDALERDTAPLPIERDREGYYGPNHFNYWASGIRDYEQLKQWSDRFGVKIESLLDFGCASGRFIRHTFFQAGIRTVIGCDINRLHVEWVSRYLPPEIVVFQNTSLPALPLPDNSVDVITAFSVFTHIESFETTWLMELRRVLKPGGIAWITVHSDRSWRELDPTWPLHSVVSQHPNFASSRRSQDLPRDRLVFRWHNNRSYSASVFYRENYLRRSWGRLLHFRALIPARPHYQDIAVLQK